MGYDSDDPKARGEVGKVGVAIDSLDDMATLMDGIPQDEVTTSMTINAPASLLLLLYELVAESKGIDAAALGGTIQNDILKEYAARGHVHLPAAPVDAPGHRHLRVLRAAAAALEHHQHQRVPHPRGGRDRSAGDRVHPLQRHRLRAGGHRRRAWRSTTSRPRLSFFFNVSNDFFEEVAKFRAARAIWAEVMRDRFGARDPRSLALRFHAQTSGATLTAQQPINNVVRVAIQALAAVCGGTQSLHTNSYDEALALPSEQAAEIALRTQQVIGFESGAAAVADPMGGSYLVERLTADLVEAARALMARVEERGGAVGAIEEGFYQHEIQDSAYRHQQLVESGERVIVGVNRFTESSQREVEILRIGAELEAAQVERLAGAARAAATRPR